MKMMMHEDGDEQWMMKQKKRRFGHEAKCGEKIGQRKKITKMVNLH